MHKNQFLPLFIGLVFLSSAASATKQFVPADLQYQGKPVDSLCFGNLADSGNQIDLKSCGATHEKYIVKGTQGLLGQKGYLGYDWQDPSVPSGGAQGFSYYQFFEAGNHQYWIYAINNGGGSGNFTDIFLVKRMDANTLQVKSVAGGDRCNGGVQDVTLKNGKLNFNVNLTAYDLIAMAEKKIPNVNAYDDLAACAICCAATANYAVDTQGKLQLHQVELDKNIKEEEMSEQGKFQACFNKLYVSYVKKNETNLDQAKVNAFAAAFKAECVGK